MVLRRIANERPLHVVQDTRRGLMKRRAFTLFILCMVVSMGVLIVSAQRSKPKTGSQEVRVISDKPSVYITYDRVGKRKPLDAGESDEGIWLRFHNNTKWTIIYAAYDIPQLYGDVGMYYILEPVSKDKVADMPDLPKGYELGHVYSTSRLKSGGSVLFSIPREHLPKGSMLRVKFSYEWENQDDVFANREAEHFVIFRASKLP